MNDDPLKIALMDFSFETTTSSSSSSSPSASAGSSSSAYDFVKGFITGQLALLALLLLIVRLLFFRSAGAIITPTTVKLDSRIFPEGRKLRVSVCPLRSEQPDERVCVC